MARLAVAVVAVSLASACGAARMTSEQATAVAVDAFASAGIEAEVTGVVEDATVDRAGDGAFIQVHQVELEVDGITYEVGVSRTDGAVVRLTESRPRLTDAQAHAIAEYRDNPAERDARGRRALLILLALALGSLVLFALFRRARLAAERAGSSDATHEIPLD